MPNYRFNAECWVDAERALSALLPESKMSSWSTTGSLEVEVSFSCELSLEEIKSRLKSVPDPHVMLRSLDTDPPTPRGTKLEVYFNEECTFYGYIVEHDYCIATDEIARLFGLSPESLRDYLPSPESVYQIRWESYRVDAVSLEVFGEIIQRLAAKNVPLATDFLCKLLPVGLSEYFAEAYQME